MNQMPPFQWRAVGHSAHPPPNARETVRCNEVNVLHVFGEHPRDTYERVVGEIAEVLVSEVPFRLELQRLLLPLLEFHHRGPQVVRERRHC